MSVAGGEGAPLLRRVVDPHHHLQDLEGFDYPWLAPETEAPRIFGGKFGELRRNYLLLDYFADASGVSLVKSVHIENGRRADQALAETRWLQALADERGFPHGIVAYVDLEAPDAADRLDRHLESPNLRGVRQILNWSPDPALRFVDAPSLMDDPAWRRGFAALAPRKLSFDLQIYPDQLESARGLSQRYPDTRIALCHAGMPIDRDEAALRRWEDGMRSLAAAGDVYVKLSGFSLGPGAFAFEAMKRLALTTIEIFGVERCMFASNFPVDGLFSDFSQLYAAFERIAAGFSAEEQRALFATNAERFYRI